MLDCGSPFERERVDKVREEEGVGSRGGGKGGRGGGCDQPGGGKRPERTVGSRRDGDGDRVPRGERAGEGGEEVEHMSDAPEGEAGEEGIHLLRESNTIGRSIRRQTAMAPGVAARIRTVRSSAGAIRPRQVSVVGQGLEEDLNDGQRGGGGGNRLKGGEIPQQAERTVPERVGTQGKKIAVRSKDAEILPEQTVSRVEVGEEVVFVELHGGAHGAKQPGGAEASSEHRDVKGASTKVGVIVDQSPPRHKAMEGAARGEGGGGGIKETPSPLSAGLNDGVRRSRDEGV